MGKTWDNHGNCTSEGLAAIVLAVLYLTDSFPRIHIAAMGVPRVPIRSRSWMIAKICGMCGRDGDDIFGLLPVSLEFAKTNVLIDKMLGVYGDLRLIY